MTVGPWRPILFHTYQNRITDLDVRSQVSESLDVNLTAEFSLLDDTPGFASFILKKPDGSREASADKMPTELAGNKKVSFSFAPSQLQLWYPVNYGAQPIYTVEVQITDMVDHQLLLIQLKIDLLHRPAMCSTRRPRRSHFGVLVLCRRSSLTRKGLPSCLRSIMSGSSVAVGYSLRPSLHPFMSRRAGSNWIPADSFLTT